MATVFTSICVPNIVYAEGFIKVDEIYDNSN